MTLAAQPIDLLRQAINLLLDPRDSAFQIARLRSATLTEFVVTGLHIVAGVLGGSFACITPRFRIRLIRRNVAPELAESASAARPLRFNNRLRESSQFTSNGHLHARRLQLLARQLRPV